MTRELDNLMTRLIVTRHWSGKSSNFSTQEWKSSEHFSSLQLISSWETSLMPSWYSKPKDLCFWGNKQTKCIRFCLISWLKRLWTLRCSFSLLFSDSSWLTSPMGMREVVCKCLSGTSWSLFKPKLQPPWVISSRQFSKTSKQPQGLRLSVFSLCFCLEGYLRTTTLCHGSAGFSTSPPSNTVLRLWCGMSSRTIPMTSEMTSWTSSGTSSATGSAVEFWSLSSLVSEPLLSLASDSSLPNFNDQSLKHHYQKN